MSETIDIQLIAKVNEAEKLVNYIQERHEDSNMAIFRWLVVADEATALLQQAEEHLTPASLQLLEARVNQIRPGCDLWAKYKDNPRRVKALIGCEIDTLVRIAHDYEASNEPPFERP